MMVVGFLVRVDWIVMTDRVEATRRVLRESMGNVMNPTGNSPSSDASLTASSVAGAVSLARGGVVTTGASDEGATTGSSEATAAGATDADVSSDIARVWGRGSVSGDV